MSDVYEIDPASGNARIVAHLQNLAPYGTRSIPGFTVSPDGKALVVAMTKRKEDILYTTTIHQ